MEATPSELPLLSIASRPHIQEYGILHGRYYSFEGDQLFARPILTMDNTNTEKCSYPFAAWHPTP
jgi:hypothetical protein